MARKPQIRTLLLNASFEPIGVIGVVRAFNLVRKGRAKVEVYNRSCSLHTSTASYPTASVVVLSHFIDIRKRRNASGKKRFHIFVRDRFRCQYCSKRFPPALLTLDHILPLSQDGPDDPENLATACKPCNQRKGNRDPDSARMPLLATPSALRYGLSRALLEFYSESRPEWRPYLFLGEYERTA